MANLDGVPRHVDAVLQGQEFFQVRYGHQRGTLKVPPVARHRVTVIVIVTTGVALVRSTRVTVVVCAEEDNQRVRPGWEVLQT